MLTERKKKHLSSIYLKKKNIFLYKKTKKTTNVHTFCHFKSPPGHKLQEKCKAGSKSMIMQLAAKYKCGGKVSCRLNIIYIDLLTIKELVGMPVKKFTPLQKWGLYFSYADDESKSEYIGQLGNSERGIMEATTIIQRMSEEDAAFFREFRRDKAMRDYNEEMTNAMKRGLGTSGALASARLRHL